MEAMNDNELTSVCISDRDPIWDDAENMPIGAFWLNRSKGLWLRRDDEFLPWIFICPVSEALNQPVKVQ